jgi:hypothetical protein
MTLNKDSTQCSDGNDLLLLEIREGSPLNAESEAHIASLNFIGVCHCF